MSGEVRMSSLSVCGRVVLSMHSLNNEGSEGNQQQTRMVHIVSEKGEPAVVNAVSGDMMKHVQAAYAQALCKEHGLPLCAGCVRFDANRINIDREFIDSLKDLTDAEAITDLLIKRCAIDDVEGILMTEGKRSVPRKSAVEFGWLVGVPEITRTESYFHVKYDPRRGAGAGDETGANVGQAIFYKPASSGTYAAVAHLELSRVGFNDISREYAIPEDDRRSRTRVLLQSVAMTFVSMDGAQCSTQAPHVEAFEGVITTSRSVVPAPMMSPLTAGYVAEVNEIAAQLNRLADAGIQVFEFRSLAEYTQRMADLVAEV